MVTGAPCGEPPDRSEGGDTAELRAGVTDVAGNLAQVWERIGAAAARSGRRPAEVTLVAVTKGVDGVRIRTAIAWGVRDLGESRVQEAASKIEALGQIVRWHMIGHLQRNKARQAAALFDVIHSLDNPRLASDLTRRAGRILDVLLQVNLSGAPRQFGIAPDELGMLANAVTALPHLRVIGLMTIAPQPPTPQTARPVFRRLRELRDALNARSAFVEPLRHLSMGMSDDFDVAVEEGATLVRIGRAIFGPRD